MSPDDGSPPGGAEGARPGGWRTVVAELDARVRREHQRITARLDGMDQRLVAVSSTTAEVLPRLEDLADALAEVRGRLDAELGSGSATPFSPVHWPTLTAEEARQAWGDLGTWVADVLTPWYAPTRGQLPDCWPLHRRAVVELSWLRTSYLVAYSSKASASTAAEWHTRWFREAFAAITRAVPPELCQPAAHLVGEQGRRYTPLQARPAPSRSPDGSAADLRAEASRPEHWRRAFDQAAQIDIAAREAAARPPPTAPSSTAK